MRLLTAQDSHMPEETILPDETKIEAAPEPKEQGYDYVTDHNRSDNAIVKQPVVEPKKEEPAEKAKPETPIEQLDKTNPLEAAKLLLEERRKEDRLEAERIARETTEKHLKQIEEQKTQSVKDAEEDKPIWEREGREPKDWTEVNAETRRIAKREVLRDLKADQEAQRVAGEKAKAEATATQNNALQGIQSKIGQEMEELYQGGYLPRPVKVGDPQDAGEKMKQKLFELGVKINEERKTAGLPPEPSIAKIFFMNADKLKDAPVAPAGGDAPVAGARPANVNQEPQGYVYAKDHRPNESFEQYARRIQLQARKS